MQLGVTLITPEMSTLHLESLGVCGCISTSADSLRLVRSAPFDVLEYKNISSQDGEKLLPDFNKS